MTSEHSPMHENIVLKISSKGDLFLRWFYDVGVMAASAKR